MRMLNIQQENSRKVLPWGKIIFPSRVVPKVISIIEVISVYIFLISNYQNLNKL